MSMNEGVRLSAIDAVRSQKRSQNEKDDDLLASKYGISDDYIARM